jgi:hypothetical protein
MSFHVLCRVSRIRRSKRTKRETERDRLHVTVPAVLSFRHLQCCRRCRCEQWAGALWCPTSTCSISRPRTTRSTRCAHLFPEVANGGSDTSRASKNAWVAVVGLAWARHPGVVTRVRRHERGMESHARNSRVGRRPLLSSSRSVASRTRAYRLTARRVRELTVDTGNAKSSRP